MTAYDDYGKDDSYNYFDYTMAHDDSSSGYLPLSKNSIHKNTVDLTSSRRGNSDSGSSATIASSTSTQSSKSELDGLIEMVKGLASTVTTVMQQVQQVQKVQQAQQNLASTDVQQKSLNDQNPPPKKPRKSKTATAMLEQESSSTRTQHGQGVQNYYPRSNMTSNPNDFLVVDSEDGDLIVPANRLKKRKSHNQAQKASMKNMQSNVTPYPQGKDLMPPYNQHTMHDKHINFNALQDNASQFNNSVGMRQADVLRMFQLNSREYFEREERRIQFERNQREKEDLVNMLRYFPR